MSVRDAICFGALILALIIFAVGGAQVVMRRAMPIGMAELVRP